MKSLSTSGLPECRTIPDDLTYTDLLKGTVSINVVDCSCAVVNKYDNISKLAMAEQQHGIRHHKLRQCANCLNSLNT